MSTGARVQKRLSEIVEVPPHITQSTSCYKLPRPNSIVDGQYRETNRLPKAKSRRTRSESISKQTIQQIFHQTEQTKKRASSLKDIVLANVFARKRKERGNTEACVSDNHVNSTVTISELRMVLANCRYLAKEERLRRLFKTLDTSGDNRVDCHEIIEAMRKRGIKPTDKEVDEVIHAVRHVDLENRESIDYNDFLRAFGMKSYKDTLRLSSVDLDQKADFLKDLSPDSPPVERRGGSRSSLQRSSRQSLDSNHYEAFLVSRTPKEGSYSTCCHGHYQTCQQKCELCIIL